MASVLDWEAEVICHNSFKLRHKFIGSIFSTSVTHELEEMNPKKPQKYMNAKVLHCA